MSERAVALFSNAPRATRLHTRLRWWWCPFPVIEGATPDSGDLRYDPALVEAPVALIRGEWDGVVPDDDARWLFDAFKASPSKRDIKIGRGTHLMHLEVTRSALYRETIAFLLGEDQGPASHGARLAGEVK